MRTHARTLIVLLAQFAASSPLLAQFNESEPNDSKGAADAFTLALTGTITGTTTGTGTSGGAITSADVFRVKTPAAAVAIYRHRLALTSTITGHTYTLRGLNQSAGVIGGSDIAFQTSSASSSPVRTIQWYGFGKQEEIYARVTGTPSTTDAYTLTHSQTTITPTVIADTLYAGAFQIYTTGATDTDMWLYDSTLTPIVDAGNETDMAVPSGPARILRTLAPGTYTLAVGRSNIGNNLASPADDASRNGNVLDFADAVAGSAVGQATVTFSVRVNDGVNPLRSADVTLSSLGVGDIGFVRFTVSARPVANDLCADAIALITGTPVNGDNTGAYTDPGESLTCLTAAGGGANKGVWYSFTAATAGWHSFVVTPNPGPTPVHTVGVFDMCGGSELACGDFNPSTLKFSAYLQMAANQSVKLLVAGVNATSMGSFQLMASTSVSAGACCNATNVCQVYPSSACVAPNTYLGSGTVCNPNVCDQRGACCSSTNACTFVLSSACISPSTFVDGACSPSPCVAGTCCAPTGSCSLGISFNCAAGSTWTAGGTACSPNPCVPNDLACNATTVTLGTPFTGSNAFATATQTVPTCSGNAPVADVWYEFTPPSHGYCDVAICHSGFLPVIFNVRGDCSDTATMTYQFCGRPDTNICPTNGTFRGWSFGSTGPAYLLVGGQVAGSPSGTFTITISASVLGACCDTTTGDCTAVPSNRCTLVYMGDNTVCSPSPCPPSGACCTSGGSCLTRTVAGCAGTGAYQGNTTSCTPNPCPQPGACCTAEGCCTITLQSACATSFVGPSTTCSSSVCGVAAPANDLCTTPPVILLNVPVSGSNCTATTDANDLPSSCGTATPYHTVWHRFTPSHTAAYSLSTCGSTSDTVLSIWYGSCGSLVQVSGGCDDDSCDGITPPGSSLASKISSVVLSASTTYRIRIASYSDYSPSSGPGAYTLMASAVNTLGRCCVSTTCTLTDAARCTGSFLPNVTCSTATCTTPAPANDTCATAAAISTGSPAVTGNNSSAATDPDENYSCPNPVYQGMWYSFAPTIGGAYIIDGAGSTQDDYTLFVFDSCGGTMLDCAWRGCCVGDGRVDAQISTGQSVRLMFATHTNGGVFPGPFQINITLGGACCVPISGACGITKVAADCVGTFMGTGTVCSPSPCPVTGSCCQAGCCGVTIAAACDGAWTQTASCSPNPCPQTPPINDACANPIPLTLGDPIYGGNCLATIEPGELNPTCTAPVSVASVWYTFTPSHTAAYTISACGSTYAARVSVWTGSCGALAQLPGGCGWGNCGSAGYGHTAAGMVSSLVLTANVTYRVRLDTPPSPGGALGPYTLVVTADAALGRCCTGAACIPTDQTRCTSGTFQTGGSCVPGACLATAPDTCATATVVGVGAPAAYGTHAGATTTTDETSACSSNGKLGIWYSFTAPATGEYEIKSVRPAFVGGALAIFSSCGGAELGCAFAGGLRPLAFYLALSAGQNIKILELQGSGYSPSSIELHITPVEAGACCDLYSGFCTFASEASCSIFTEQFLGVNSVCTPVPCTPPGVCCTPGATCIAIIERPYCTGVHAGDATTCASSPCPTAWGACCVQGCCFQFYQAQCGAGYRGDGTTCAPNPCPAAPPTNETCATAIALSSGTELLFCNADSINENQEPAPTCDSGAPGIRKSVWFSFTPATGGALQGSVASLTNGYHPVAVLYTGSCGALTEVACWRGLVTPTVLDLARPATGSSLLAAGTLYSLVVGVGSIGGSQGGPTRIQITLPTPPTGACCAGATCSVIAPAACTGPNTRFVGSGAACNAPPNNVTPCCKADFNQIGGVTVADIFAYLSAWFASNPQADINGLGGINVADIFAYLSAWFARC